MNPVDVLQTTAELSLALAGFAGITMVFVYRGREPPKRADVVRFWRLLTFSLGALLFSVVPLPFATDGQPLGWRGLILVQGLCLLAVALVHVRTALRVPTGNLLLFSAMVAGSMLVAGYLLASATSSLFEASFRPYLTGVVWQLLAGAFSFARLLHVGISHTG